MTLKVLLGTDGSEPAIEAARETARLFPTADEIVVVAVAQPTTVIGPALATHTITATEVEVAEELRRQALETAHAAAETTARALPSTVKVTQRVEPAVAPPGEIICRLARELGVDVIVVGSRGLGAIKRALLGSVSTYVVRHARGPVLVVRDDADPDDGGDDDDESE